MHSELLRTRHLLAGTVVSLLISLQIIETVAEPYHKIRYDFIVIGGGADGYIIAKRLSENPNWKVLIIEAANYGNVSDFYFVERTNKTLAHRIRWPRLSHEQIPKQYVRGVPQDYDLWLQKGNHGWGWDDLLPYFEKSVGEAGSAYMPESYVVLNESVPLNQDFEEVEEMILSENTRSKSLRLLHTAETGICNLPYTEVRNSDAINKRPNLHMITNAEPKRINFDASKERVKSVTIMYNYRELTVEFNKEIVLAAGAIDTAKILMLSGVGIKEHLNSFNIRVLHDLPVGQNLQDHLALSLFFSTPILNVHPPVEETTKNFTEKIIQRLQTFGDHGMLSLTEFVNTIPRSKSKTPDIEYHYHFIKHHDFATLRNWSTIAGLYWQFYNILESTLLTKNLLIIQAVLTHSKSTGSVELRSANCMDNPKILANYLDNPEDVETLLRGIHHVENKLKSPSFENVKLLKIPNPECYKDPLEDDSYWRCYIKYMAMPQVNHVGTVKMGTNKNESCVNPHLLVHGVKNLRVADASIMPDIPSSEIHAATLMIAEKAVDLIKMDWK